MQKKAASSPSLGTKFKASPPKKKEGPPDHLLDTESAFNATSHRCPKFTIREKLPPADRLEKRPGAYNVPGHIGPKGPASSPKWSMNARATGLPKPPQAPGPGSYENKSTMYMIISGRPRSFQALWTIRRPLPRTMNRTHRL